MRPPLKLAHSLFVPSGATNLDNFSPALMFHCILGCRKSWDRIAQNIADKAQLQVYTLDLLNHGESPTSYQCGLLDMSLDVELFFEEKKIKKCDLIGHSLGGRLAMILALQKPSLVRTLTVVDVSPIYQPPQMPTQIYSWLNIMRNVIKELHTSMSLMEGKELMDKKLMEANVNASLRPVLLDTLVKKNSTFSWMTDLDAVEAVFETHIFRFPDLSPLSYSGPTQFLASEKPTYLKLKDHVSIYKLFPKAEISYVPGTSHQLPFDNTERFIKEVLNFRKRYDYLPKLR